MSDLKLYNTLTRKKEVFQPLKPPKVGFYACGPTVYDFSHIGHFRAYIFVDTLRRVLEAANFEVKQVMNITDVGHLTSDEDTGEDKMEVGALREKKTVWEIAQFYTDDFFASMEKLNVLRPEVVCRATEHISEMIDLIKKIEKNGFTYQTSEGIYFDTSKLKDYGRLAGLNIEGLRSGARVEASKDKKNLTDFALWRFSPKNKKRAMEWESAWGKGFPGWHIECTAMSVKYLGENYDVHTGGVDHIPVHHTNEIAQAEGAFGHDVVRFWLHNEFVLVEGRKMSKSLHNFYTMKEVEEKGFEPLSLRYLFLTCHYRKRINFTWKSLSGAQAALKKLREEVLKIKEIGGVASDSDKEKFMTAVFDDLNTAKALAILWQMIDDQKIDYQTLKKFDRILGLSLLEQKESKIPGEVKKLVEEREGLRKQGQWQAADRLREKIRLFGFAVEDADNKSILKKLN